MTSLTRSPHRPNRFTAGACQLAGVVLLCLLLTDINAKELTQIRHYDKGYSPHLRVYLTDVLQLVLDKTTPTYGPYDLKYYSQNLSANRSKLETERGELIDILFSTHWRGHFVNPKNVTQIDYPILYGMLGLRSLIISKDNTRAFEGIQSENQFLHFSAGQGSSWTDIGILQANNIEVVEAEFFDGLFPMLEKRRFDYLPLSILEAQTALQAKGVQYNNLTMAENINVFYPMPFYLYVNKGRPILAERLKIGLEIATADGSIERLFQRHFYYLDQLLKSNDHKLMVLNNPFLTPEHNAQELHMLLESNPNIFQVLHYFSSASTLLLQRYAYSQ